MDHGRRHLSNQELASQLDEAGDLLAEQDADQYRVRAYHRGAQTLRQLRESAVEILKRGGRDALMELPAIGESLSRAIEEIAHLGRFNLLARLRGDVAAEELLMTLPGMGLTLAARVHAELGVASLEELQLAAHDGRLATVEGFGPRRLRAVRELLAHELGSRSPLRHPIAAGAADEFASVPTVALLLSLDARFRQKLRADELPKVAPRRFNPERRRWLPIWHISEDGFDFTVLLSNSAQAHKLRKTHDWVVLYWERVGLDGQATVVTEFQGPLTGRRVVRGQERRCLKYWAQQTRDAAWRARYERAG